MLPEIIAVSSAAIALLAIVRALSTHRKLASLSQSYWELRYEFARLRARVAKLDGGQSAVDPEDPVSGEPRA